MINNKWIINLTGSNKNITKASFELKKIYELNKFTVKITNIKSKSYLENINLDIPQYNLKNNFLTNENIIINKLGNIYNLDLVKLNLLFGKISTEIIPIIFKVDSKITNIQESIVLENLTYNNFDKIYPLCIPFNSKYKEFKFFL